MNIAKTACGHIEALTKTGTVEGVRGTGVFLDTGNVLNFASGLERQMPVLRFLRETKNGGLSVTSTWMEVKFCPMCGVPVEYEEGQANDPHEPRPK